MISATSPAVPKTVTGKLVCHYCFKVVSNANKMNLSLLTLYQVRLCEQSLRCFAARVSRICGALSSSKARVVPRTTVVGGGSRDAAPKDLLGPRTPNSHKYGETPFVKQLFNVFGQISRTTF